MEQSFIVSIDQRRLPKTIGTKAQNLRKLKDLGFRIPITYICTWDAYEHHQQGKIQLDDQFIQEIIAITDPNSSYAVRSSANIEDGLNFSFAGQFKSLLFRKGIDNILEAIQEVWWSAKSTRLDSYLDKTSGQLPEIRMAVIIQEMVNPEISGISFSKNPITSLDEIIVEAVHGSGEQLVQEGVSPLRWVDKWGYWLESPEDTRVPPELIRDVIVQTRNIAKSLHKDIDLEWVYNGENLYWVQMRDITANQVKNIYSNRISKEMIPGQIKPLVWSIAIPTYSALWLKILQDLIGKNQIDLNDMIRAFYYRAYFNMGVFGQVFESLGLPHEFLEMMMGLVPPGADKPRFKPTPTFLKKIPRLIGFLGQYARYDRNARTLLPALKSEMAGYASQLKIDPPKTEEALLSQINALQTIYRQASHATIIVQLLMFIHNRLFASRLKKLGYDPNSFDITEGMDEIKEFDPNIGLSELNSLFRQLDGSLQSLIRAGCFADVETLPEMQPFVQRLDDFWDNFGHFSDSNVDFSYPSWRENSEMILQIVADFKLAKEKCQHMKYYADITGKGFSGWILGLLFRRARLFRYYREAFSALFTRSLGLLRSHYLLLADLLTQKKILEERQDIFYLTHSELEAIIRGHLTAKDTIPLISQRKIEMEECGSVPLPEVIYGDVPPPISKTASQILMGVPTSRGYFTGRIRCIHNLSEISKLQDNDVLVIPFSDTSWLPLFAKVGAVISESGGMLSHSSITAREYGIPAVVSVNGAMQLQDDLLASIDGFKGEIRILSDQGS